MIRRTGAQILAWLNQSAQLFRTLECGKTDQELFSAGVAPYDFDVIFGLTYSINIGRDTDRVIDLRLNGKPVLGAIILLLQQTVTGQMGAVVYLLPLRRILCMSPQTAHATF